MAILSYPALAVSAHGVASRFRAGHAALERADFAPVPSRILRGHCFGSDEVIASCTGGRFAGAASRSWLIIVSSWFGAEAMAIGIDGRQG
jgi:hypothetical protein